MCEVVGQMDPYHNNNNNYWGNSDGFNNNNTNAMQQSDHMNLPNHQTILHIHADVKPRLTKEQHDILEKHFKQQAKPSTAIKRGYADTLGVPLDKINNWFQNRRAKVKQDYKKQANAAQTHAELMHQQIQHQHQMHQQQHHQQMQGMHPQQQLQHPQQFLPPAQQLPSSVPSDPYAQQQDLSPTSLPVDHGEPSRCANVANTQMQTAPDHYGMLNPIPEVARPASSHEILHNLNAAGYSHMLGMPQLNSTFPQGLHAGLFQQYDWDTDCLPSNGQPSGPIGELSDSMGGMFDFETSTEDGTVPIHDLDSNINVSVSSLPSTASTAQSAHSFSDQHSIPTVTTSLAEWENGPDDSDAVAAPISVSPCENNDTDERQLLASSRQDSIDTWSMVQQPHFAMTQNMFQQANSVSPGAKDQALPDQQDDMDTMINFPPEASERRGSSTAALAESMSTVGIQTPTSTNHVFQQPSASNLAARRQRPRPAALGAPALQNRSSSYSAGMPVSPGTHASLQDHNLRRIKSSTAVQHRIQKPSTGASQRSPMHASFSSADLERVADNAKFGRHGFANVTVTSPSNTGTLAPPTPLTPGEMSSGFPSWQQPRNGQSQSGTSDNSPEAISIPWSNDRSSYVGSYTVSSPPTTPLDAEQMAQFRLQAFQQQALHRDTPPQSAPATQQSFAKSVFNAPLTSQPGTQHMNPGMSTPNFRGGHWRTPSLPEGAQTMQFEPQQQQQAHFFAPQMPMIDNAGQMQMGCTKRNNP
ncbi:hypothetical protein K402DRAFT_452210 [Aulographum hederae CBS 113979]|uniref:Homeobox domain-containing protein n=1 Tax=Aulographum hederae CBS 113979 TaxID=1176131 RepID=A0A6G1H974_9PEZI|nr:hypothetical protein K402DRAFT_452210 [Aulographum hederae CBS 113979]